MMNDIQLQQAVLEELQWEPSVEASHIGVAASGGVVTLMGHVRSYPEKRAAENAARRVRGVGAIVQEIDVRIPVIDQDEDDEIAKRALSILHWNVGIPHERIIVKVERGVVTLSGTVEWQYLKDRAEAGIRQLSGVVGVINTIAIKPVVEPVIQSEQLREKIKVALERQADVEADKVCISVDGGKVTVSGVVGSWSERLAIENAIWSAPGVTEVIDRMGLQI